MKKRIEILPHKMGCKKGDGGKGREATPEELSEYLRKYFEKFVDKKKQA